MTGELHLEADFNESNEAPLKMRKYKLSPRLGLQLAIHFFFFSFLSCSFVCCLPRVYILQRAIDQCSTGMRANLVHIQRVFNERTNECETKNYQENRLTGDNGSSEIGEKRPNCDRTHRTRTTTTTKEILCVFCLFESNN